MNKLIKRAKAAETHRLRHNQLGPKEVYCDGGLCSHNPSLIGGTWCWCWVAGKQVIYCGSGFVSPSDLGRQTISNNTAELIAAMRALQSIENLKTWEGTLYTDSMITRQRLLGCGTSKGVPPGLWSELQCLLAVREWNVDVVLIGGHPTRKELEIGHRQRNGLPVSQWNAYCDKECTRLANKWRHKK